MDEKLTRLIEILQEAKSIIKEIEEEIGCNNQKPKYEDIRLDCLDVPRELNRVINVAKMNKIYTLGDLLKYTRREMTWFRNLGRRSVNCFADYLKEQYNIDWI